MPVWKLKQLLLFRRVRNIVVLLVMSASVAVSQETKQDSVVKAADTRFAGDTTRFVMQHSPALAVGGAVLLPGFGQAYNGDYWKLPLVYGFGAYFASVAISQHKLYSDAKNNFSRSTNAQDSATYKGYRDFYRDQRDEFLVYLGLTYIAQIIDAYVGAHLYDFNTVFSYDGHYSRLGFRIHF